MASTSIVTTRSNRTIWYAAAAAAAVAVAVALPALSGEELSFEEAFAG